MIDYLISVMGKHCESDIIALWIQYGENGGRKWKGWWLVRASVEWPKNVIMLLIELFRTLLLIAHQTVLHAHNHFISKMSTTL